MIAAAPGRAAAAALPDAGRGVGRGVVDDRLSGADRSRDRAAAARHAAQIQSMMQSAVALAASQQATKQLGDAKARSRPDRRRRRRRAALARRRLAAPARARECGYLTCRTAPRRGSVRAPRRASATGRPGCPRGRARRACSRCGGRREPAAVRRASQAARVARVMRERDQVDAERVGRPAVARGAARRRRARAPGTRRGRGRTRPSARRPRPASAAAPAGPARRRRTPPSRRDRAPGSRRGGRRACAGRASLASRRHRRLRAHLDDLLPLAGASPAAPTAGCPGAAAPCPRARASPRSSGSVTGARELRLELDVDGEPARVVARAVADRSGSSRGSNWVGSG